MSKAVGILRNGDKVEITGVREDGSVEIDHPVQKVADKFDFADVWYCDCVTPEKSCPACRAKAREVYGNEIPWEVA